MAGAGHHEGRAGQLAGTYVPVIRFPGRALEMMQRAHGVTGMNLQTPGLRPYHDKIVVLTICLWDHGRPVPIVLHFLGGTDRNPEDLARKIARCRA